MSQFNIAEAKTHFSELVQKAMLGCGFWSTRVCFCGGWKATALCRRKPARRWPIRKKQQWQIGHTTLVWG